jgi:uncharacterized protein
MASEFHQRMPQILAMTAAEALLKIGVQEAVAQTGSPLLQLVATVATNVSSADTRSWTALPSQFDVARVETPKDGKLHIRAINGADLGTVDVPSSASSIVYVKLGAAGAPPAVHVVRL